MAHQAHQPQHTQHDYQGLDDSLHGQAPADEAASPVPQSSRTHHTQRGQHRQRTQRLTLSLAWVVEEYLRDLRRSELSPKTIQDYRKILGLAERCSTEQLGRPRPLTT